MNNSYLVLFGSGEISSEGRKIHEYVFKKIGKKEVRVCILTTPAGFQPNVKFVHEKIAEFFTHSLRNFHPRVDIVYANTTKETNTLEILKPVTTADYIFMGPGSPTYAIRMLRGSLLCRMLYQQIQKGTHLALSSASVIAFSSYALPVYEIYKVGSSFYWEQGLDFYAQIFQTVTVLPHLNNREGGDKLDTTFCYMGKERFGKLLHLLPMNEKVWGIDEQTGVVINTLTKEVSIMGKGNVHALKNKFP